MSTKPGNPFKGLRSYSREDYGSLFGRNADFILMKDRIFAGRTTLLFAGSGIGKTSFFEAKLIPELEQRPSLPLQIRYHRRWTAGDPMSAVRETLEAAPEESLTSFFTRNPGHWILVLDQFEELFQNTEYWSGSADFRDQIAAVVRSSLPVSIVISMREEFLGHLSLFDNKVPDIFRNYYRLRNPDQATAADIIGGICGATPVDHDGLASLVADLSEVEISAPAGQTQYVSRDAVFLPFLQLVCLTLWNQQPEPGDGPFTFLADYAELRRKFAPVSPPAEILERFCAGQLQKLPQAQRVLASRALDYLIASHGSKRAYASSDLAAYMRLRAPAELDRTLLALTTAGILRSWHRGRENWFELSHDMYAPILYRWKERAQAARRLRTRWAAAAVLGLVLLVIVSVVVWSQRRNRETIEASQRLNRETIEASLRRNRETIAAAFDGRATYSEQENRDEALIFRLAALEANPTDERRRATAAASFPSRQIIATLRHNAPVTAMAFTSNGKLIVTAVGLPPRETSDDAVVLKTELEVRAVVQAWDAQTGRRVGKPWKLVETEPPSRVALAPSTNLLAAATRRGDSRVWDIALWGPESKDLGGASLDCELDKMAFDDSGTRLLTTCVGGIPESRWIAFDVGSPRNGKDYKPLVTAMAQSVAFSSDGHIAAAGRSSGEIELWDLVTGRQIGPVTKQDGGITYVVFARDGKTFAASDTRGRVVLYDATSGRRLGDPLDAGSIVLRMDFTGDGHTLLAARDVPNRRDAIRGFFTRWNLLTRQKTEVPVSHANSNNWFPLPDRNLVIQRSSELAFWDATRGVPVKHAAASSASLRYLLSRDGTELLTWPGGGTVHVWSTAGSEPYVGLGSGESALDRDGGVAAFLEGRRSLLLLRGTAEQRISLSSDAFSLAISPEGNYVAVYTDGAGQMYDTRSGNPFPKLAIPGDLDFQLAIREDGAVVARPGNHLVVYPVGATAPRPVPGADGLSLKRGESESLSRWGTYFAHRGDTLRVWDTRSGVVQEFSDIKSGRPGFTADERFLFVTSEDGVPTIIPLATRKPFTLAHTGATRIAVSPTGSFALTAADDLRVWDVRANRLISSVPFNAALRALEFSPDGDWFFAATRSWAYWFQTSRPGSPEASRYLPGMWSGNYGLVGGRPSVTALLSVAGDWWHAPIEISPSNSTVAPLEGDPTELRDRWQKKLNLKLVSGELVPIDQLVVSRSRKE